MTPEQQEMMDKIVEDVQRISSNFLHEANSYQLVASFESWLTNAYPNCTWKVTPNGHNLDIQVIPTFAVEEIQINITKVEGV